MGSISTSQSYDLTSGQDAAHKMGQEHSALLAKQAADLYGADIPSLLASTSRIRDIQNYLRAVGAPADEIEVIPRARLQSSTSSATQRTDD